ncbi:MAG TPA: NAD(P)-binding domain-containing protein [Pyrinomonadaceae bacterium]|jgi:putative YpdA family bacillithiol system oxidoreductase|nr:NAD(P)-binding domain-containing protein [Pyrinomonadaceae bacterium]
MADTLDLLIIGAGPAGLSAADAAAREGLAYLVIERGTIANTIRQYPVGRTMFSTPNELEMREGSLQPIREKPTREELLSHYIHFVLDNDLRVNTGEEVNDVEAADSEGFIVRTRCRSSSARESKNSYRTRTILFAIGAMEHPRRLSVPGEGLPKVHHRFVDPYPYIRKDALVVGGGNSAAEAALFLSEEGARTTMAIWREDWENRDPKAGAMKHWVRSPLEREIAVGRLRVILYKHIDEITVDSVRLTTDGGESLTIPNDVVFVLVGSDADLTLLKKLGVQTAPGKLTEVPVYDPETFETHVSGIYVAGHFTNARHIKAAIDVPRKIVPLIAQSLRTTAVV